MATWPIELPSPLLEGNTISAGQRSIATPMEAGPQRVTLLSKRPEWIGRYTLYLTTAAERDAWFQLWDDSDHGTQWINDAPVDTGRGKAPHRIRILNPTITVAFPQDARHKVTFDLETDQQVSA